MKQQHETVFRQNVTTIHEVQTGLYELHGEHDFDPGWQQGDLLWVVSSEGRKFITTVQKVQGRLAQLYMSRDYEDEMQGDIAFELLFSFLASVDGAGKVMEVTRIFPACHYEKIVAFSADAHQVVLDIHLSMFEQILRINMTEIGSGGFEPWEVENELLQLDFRNHPDGIQVHLSSNYGLQGTLTCKKVHASLLPVSVLKG